jgi:NADPH-dependent glutamate synthase beta subunit-like oxidoreductase/ferredoxin
MNNKFKVEVPDVAYYRSKVDCQAACPVHTDARGYIMAIHDNDYERAYRIAREPNPMSSMCGAVCGAPCETACRRGVVDRPLSIRALKKAITTHSGPEARLQHDNHEVIPLPVINAPELDESTTRWSRTNLKKLAAQKGHKRGKVAIVGGGPAGLTAAHDLALLGHKVTLYEAGPSLGGTVRYGVPIYRIDQNLLNAEAQEILDLGVDLKLNTPIGKEVTLADLRRENDAVFLAIGLMKGRQLPMEGVDLEGVMTAVDMLLKYNLGQDITLGENVLVIGGGDVAMDGARTALRLKQKIRQVPGRASHSHAPLNGTFTRNAYDMALSPIERDAVEINMIALESWQNLPGSDVEIEEMLEEGIKMQPSVGPKRIIGQNGKVVGLEVWDALSVFDEQGRFNPKFDETSVRVMEVDTLILAIGQSSDMYVLNGCDDIEVTRRGLLKVDPDTFQTTAPDVFAGGDIALGPRLIIDAVRTGHIASLSINSRLQERKTAWITKGIWELRDRIARHLDWIDQPRKKVPTNHVEHRTGTSQVEVSYSKEEAHLESTRCFECSVHPVFNSDLCVLCNRCVDVCPWNCLKIVSLDMLQGVNNKFEEVVQARYGFSLLELVNGQNGPIPSAMLKDDESCTRCALCADHCPTNAITMETFRFTEELSYV